MDMDIYIYKMRMMKRVDKLLANAVVLRYMQRRKG